jgi:hypothetical protein
MLRVFNVFLCGVAATVQVRKHPTLTVITMPIGQERPLPLTHTRPADGLRAAQAFSLAPNTLARPVRHGVAPVATVQHVLRSPLSSRAGVVALQVQMQMLLPTLCHLDRARDSLCARRSN